MSRYRALYGNPGHDVSIRAEISGTLFSSRGEFPRGKPLIFRRMKRDQYQNPVLCPQCRMKGTLSHARAHVCDKCWGMGYLWKEEWVVAYSWPGQGASPALAKEKKYEEQGVVDSDFNVFYLEYQVKPTLMDKLIEVRLDDEGAPLSPTKPIRVRSFDIRNIDEYRLDSGRLEYWRLTCDQEKFGFIGQPLDLMIPSRGQVP